MRDIEVFVATPSLRFVVCTATLFAVHTAALREFVALLAHRTAAGLRPTNQAAITTLLLKVKMPACRRQYPPKRIPEDSVENEGVGVGAKREALRNGAGVSVWWRAHAGSYCAHFPSAQLNEQHSLAPLHCSPFACTVSAVQLPDTTSTATEKPLVQH